MGTCLPARPPRTQPGGWRARARPTELGLHSPPSQPCGFCKMLRPVSGCQVLVPERGQSQGLHRLPARGAPSHLLHTLLQPGRCQRHCDSRAVQCPVLFRAGLGAGQIFASALKPAPRSVVKEPMIPLAVAGSEDWEAPARVTQPQVLRSLPACVTLGSPWDSCLSSDSPGESQEVVL